jgi:hypothetical protein
MANSYTDQPTIVAGEAVAKQQAFLHRNHHNISPWMYTPHQIKQRNHALFLMEFDRCQKRYKIVSYPTASGDVIALKHFDRQLAAAMELAPDAGEGEV